MAKGKIIIIKENEKGIVQNDNGHEITFVQPYLTDLGMKVGTVVRFDVYTDPTTGEKTAYNVELYKKGIIIIKENEKYPTVQDENFGVIPVYEPLLKEQGIVDGSKISYELLNPSTGTGPVAVYAKLVAPK